ncbi:MAG: dienelactone hydrolase [Verrucomicrobiales bacterium]|nr:dienelactone hydrolase [Verrucomicrobiales bacterium]
MSLRKHLLWLAVLFVPLLAFAQSGAPVPSVVSFTSDGTILRAYIYKPSGHGPFPAFIWNTASSKKMFDPGDEAQFTVLARNVTSRGYVLFIPDRHSNSQSRGVVNGGELTEQLRAEEKDPINLNRRAVEFYESHNKDVLAAVEFLKAQSFVDENQIAMAGTASGAVQTLLAAEKETGIRAFIVFAPGSASWSENPLLQAMLRRSVRNAKAPVFVIQAQNDFTLEPSQLLGKELEQKGAPNRTKVYPPFGTSHAQGNAFALNGCNTWSSDVFDFVREAMN